MSMVSLVGAALGFALFGSKLLLSLSEQFRWTIISSPSLLSPHAFRIMTGVCYGGIISFALCFLLIAGIFFENSATYDCRMILIASVFSIGASIASMYIASSDRIYTKDKEELFGMLLREMSRYRLSSIRNPSVILRHALTTGSSPLLLSGLISGISSTITIYLIICAMHTYSLSYVIEYVILVFLLSIVMHTAIYITVFRIVTLFPNRVFVRIAVLLLIPSTLIICCFAALSSVTLTDQSRETIYHVDSLNVLSIVGLILGVMMMILHHLVHADMRQRLLVLMKPLAGADGENQEDADESILEAVVRSMRANSPKKSSYKAVNSRIYPDSEMQSRPTVTITMPFELAAADSIATAPSQDSAVFILQDVL